MMGGSNDNPKLRERPAQEKEALKESKKVRGSKETRATD
jgi:hypothetical protein